MIPLDTFGKQIGIHNSCYIVGTYLTAPHPPTSGPHRYRISCRLDLLGISFLCIYLFAQLNYMLIMAWYVVPSLIPIFVDFIDTLQWRFLSYFWYIPLWVWVLYSWALLLILVGVVFRTHFIGIGIFLGIWYVSSRYPSNILFLIATTGSVVPPYFWRERKSGNELDISYCSFKLNLVRIFPWQKVTFQKWHMLVSVYLCLCW